MALLRPGERGPGATRAHQHRKERQLVQVCIAAGLVAVLLVLVMPDEDVRLVCGAALLASTTLGVARIRAQRRRSSHRLLVAALEDLGVGLDIVDAQGVSVLQNKLARDAHGPALTSGPDATTRATFRAATAALANAVPARDCEVTADDGSLRLHVTAAALTTGTGRLLGAVAMSTDVTAAHDRQAEVRAIAAARRSVLAESDVRAAVCRAARDVTAAMLTILFEVDGSELVATTQNGAELAELRLPLDGESVAAQTFRSARSRIVTSLHSEPSYSVSFAAKLEEQSGCTIGAVAYIPLLADGRCRGVLTAIMDSTRPVPSTPVIDVLELLAGEAVVALTREDLRHQLMAQARTDPLTNLPNRRALTDHLEHLSRDGGIAILDLGRFKSYNDTHGHPAGDRLLVLFAGVLQQTLRSEDIPARLGGEEFAVLTPDGLDLPGLMDRLRDAWAAERTGVTFSAGISVHRADCSVADTFRIADDACYAAKRTGRDQTVSAESAIGMPGSTTADILG